MSTTSSSKRSAFFFKTTTRSRASVQNALFLAFAAALLSAGLAYQMIQATFDGWVLGVGAVLGFVLEFVIIAARLVARLQKRIVIGALVVLFLAIVIEPTSVLQGFAGILNAFIVTIDLQNQLYILPFVLSSGTSMIGMLASVLSLTLVASLVVWFFARLSSITLSVLFPLLCLVGGIYTQTASLPSMLLMSLGMMLFICSHVLRVQLTLRGGKHDKMMRRWKQDENEGDLHVLTMNYPVAIVVLTAVLALVLGSVCGLVAGPYAQANQLRSSTVDNINTFRFGEDPLPSGVFSRAASMNDEDEGGYETRLSVEFSSADAITPMYFRAFCGTDYQGNQMSQATYVPYSGEWTGLFTWLDSFGFDPITQNAFFTELNNEEEQAASHAHRTLQIKVENADRRFSYAPYQARTATREQQLLDMNLVPDAFFGTETTDITWVENSQANELFAPPDWINSPTNVDQETASFVQAEHAYRAFAEATYAQPNQELSPLIRAFFFSDQWDGNTSDLYSVVTRIRTMLDAQCIYTATPDAFSSASDGDYVTWFLTDVKRGNSSAFATSAVLAFRELGIPARYREGYFLTNEIASALKASGDNSVVLTAREAHSWCEVYINGVGWTPIEVTPGFYDKNLASTQTIEVSREVAGNAANEQTGTFGEDSSWDDWIPPELRPFAWIGLILLVVIIVLLILCVLELQRRIRIAIYGRKLTSALDAGQEEIPEVSRLLYERLAYVMAGSALPFDEARPAESQAAICRMVGDMRTEEYAHMVELLERERFGGIAINTCEAAFIQDVTYRIERSIWLRASLWRRFVLRYRRLFSFPLIGETKSSEQNFTEPTEPSQKKPTKKPTRRKKA